MPTIGYEVVTWAESWLTHHLTGQPWQYTPSQVNLILWWYALAGPGPKARWLFRTGVRRGAKGTGKDPLLATLALAELCGPTAPTWTGTEWRAFTRPFSLVQIGANSEGQARDPLMVANAMCDHEFRVEYAIDPGLTRTNAGSSRLELLTRSEASSEGDPATAVFLNETHHMTESNQGHALAAVGRRNVAKSPGGLARILEFTNTHMPGEASVAEESYDAWQAQVAGRTARADILYDSREAPPHITLTDEDSLMEGIRAAYADAPWVDLERIAAEAMDPRVPAADSVRYYLSSLPTSMTAWVQPRRFDALAAPAEPVTDGTAITLFLDCSKRRDATALVGCRIADGHIFALGVWSPPHGAPAHWSVPREEVDARLRQVFATYDVQWCGVDPSPAKEDDSETAYWGALLDDWHVAFRDRVLLWATPGRASGSAIGFDLRQSIPGGRERLREFTEVAEQTAAAIDEAGTLTWDGDPVMRAHVHNARRRPNLYGISLGKRSSDSEQLVDYAVAMVGARVGLRALQRAGLRRASGLASF